MWWGKRGPERPGLNQLMIKVRMPGWGDRFHFLALLRTHHVPIPEQDIVGTHREMTAKAPLTAKPQDRDDRERVGTNL